MNKTEKNIILVSHNLIMNFMKEGNIEDLNKALQLLDLIEVD